MKYALKGTTGSQATDAALRDIYDAINQLQDALGRAETGSVMDTQGAVGSIRIVSKGNNLYVVAVKSKDGWLVSDTTTFTFTNTLS